MAKIASVFFSFLVILSADAFGLIDPAGPGTPRHELLSADEQEMLFKLVGKSVVIFQKGRPESIQSFYSELTTTYLNAKPGGHLREQLSRSFIDSILSQGRPLPN